MRTDVLNQSRLRLVRSAGLIALAALAAGCSADATRLQDSFYTGAIPPAPVGSQAVAASAPTYGAGQPNASYGAGTTGASRTYAAATPPVSRSTLPPPPAASYSGGNDTYAPVQSQPVAPMAQASASPVNRAEVARTEASRNMGSTSVGSAGSYVVTSGDSVLGIARRHNVRAADLRSANGLSDDNIKIGQKLVIPAGGSVAAAAPAETQKRYAELGTPPTSLQAQAAAIAVPRSAPANARPAAQAARELPPAKPAQVAATAIEKPAAAVKPAAQETPAVAANPAPSAPSAASTSVAAAAPARSAAPAPAEEETEEASIAPSSSGISQMRWPVQGRVIKSFGDKVGSRRNDGLNISVPRGTPIKAAENGVVIYAGEGLKEFGKTVLVKHDNGLVTVYGYADDIKVQRGATVKRGQEIATAGMTGEADAPMLHFEVRKDSSPVNPMTYLR